MILIAVQVLGSAAAAGLGCFLIKRSRPAGLALAGLSTLLLVAAALAGRSNAITLVLSRWEGVVAAMVWWHLFPAFCLAGAAWPTVAPVMWKRDGVLIAVGFLLLRAGTIAWTDQETDHSKLTGRVRDDGVCLQTSGYSCSAASGAMFLHRLGLEATERELAGLFHTRSSGPSAGNHVVGILNGLRAKLGSRWSVRLEDPPYEELPLPSMVSVRWGSILHSVTLVERGPEGVVILDPLFGRRAWTREEFEREKVGALIWAERRP